MDAPGLAKTVDQLRARAESAERTFDTILSHQPATKKLWREWKAATEPSKKAELYARLRTITLGSRLGALVMMREYALADLEAAAAAARKTA